MKALTVCQPWAWAIMDGRKRIENRSWATRYRGPLVIHAGLSRKMMGSEGDLLPDLPDDLAFGAILGIVDVVDCVPLSAVNHDRFAFGPWCWVLERPTALARPIPYRGAQGIFDIPDELLEGASRARENQKP